MSLKAPLWGLSVIETESLNEGLMLHPRSMIRKMESAIVIVTKGGSVGCSMWLNVIFTCGITDPRSEQLPSPLLFPDSGVPLLEACLRRAASTRHPHRALPTLWSRIIRSKDTLLAWGFKPWHCTCLKVLRLSIISSLYLILKDLFWG